ncbi:MAG: inositol monophosphatase [Albidovulum sp.]|nr:inositol monophosphatase [Albidovulum sp.]
MSKAARRASRRLMHDFVEIEHLLSSIRGTGDFARRSWVAAENALMDSLSEARPNYGMRTESIDRHGNDPTRRWILDGLDGKFNFRRGVAHWAISIALEHKGEIVAAVVLDPLRNEEFHSIKGSGSRMNKMRLRSSSCSSVSEMLVAADRSFANVEDGAFQSGFVSAFERVGGVRISGALSLDLVYVAAGRFDGYLGFSCMLPSFAAASLIAKEAGVIVECLDKVESESSSFAAIAGCGRVFEKFSGMVNQSEKR